MLILIRLKKGNIIFKVDGEETSYTYERDGTSAVIDDVVYARGQ